MPVFFSHQAMRVREKAHEILSLLRESIPLPKTELAYSSPFQLLVAVILSAQCTDKRVNLVTPGLFGKYPDARAMAEASFEDILEEIKSVSFPNNKARHLKKTAEILEATYQGQVPGTMEELTLLPGVGRKTANVILSIIFSKPTLAVDTHVFRVSHRLGLARKTDQTPLKVETRLVRLISEDQIADAHHLLLLHGRYVCKALKPQCQECVLSALCPSFTKESQK